ncbi:MAG: cell division protein FtsZ [Muribaculaceae bacterium]|nr:cell division protein FtsZ [Muribaculaceae bacterium]
MQDNLDMIQPLEEASYVDTDAPLIKVIGVGGGGSNAVNYMYNQKIPKVRFVVCNTDRQHLEDSPVPYRVLLGENITQGRGAGNKPDVGKKCAEASADSIKELFTDGTEMVFITAGMGGGTGTGAAPVVAKLAKEAGMLTIGIVTVPFMFEGEQKIIKAINGAKEMREHVDALLLINNENLIELYPDLNFFNAFEKADDTLANAARSVSEIISERCYINVDFEDVRTTLKDSGTAIISTAYGEGEHRLSDAIHNALHSPLLKKHDIYTSKRLLLKFACSRQSQNALKAQELGEINHFTSKLPEGIDVKWGVADDPSLGDKVRVTVLASGFDVSIREDKKEEKVIVFEGDTKTKDNRDAKTKNDDSNKIAEIYGTDKVMKQKRNAAKMKYAVLTPGQFDDFEVITLIENSPTFTRAPRFNEELKKVSETAGGYPEPIMRDKETTENKNTRTISFGDTD